MRNRRSCGVALSVATTAGALLLLVLLGCVNPLQPPKSTTGSICGYARYIGGGDCSGITVSAESTSGVKSLSVQRLLAAPAPGQQVGKAVAAQATTGTSGDYTLTGLPPGSYTVYASSASSLEKAVTTSVTVTAGQAVTASDLNLTPTGSISGSVTLDGVAGGDRLGIAVFIAGTSYCAMTNSSGAYTISSVPAGTGYVLVASKAGYDAATASVEVTAGSTTTAATLNLVTHAVPVSTGSISGTAQRSIDGVHQSGGNAGIFVYLEGSSWITLTDDSGCYTLSGVAPGSYTLVASKEGYTPASTEVSVTAGGSASGGTLSLAAARAVTPVFVPGSGTYSGDQLVTLSCATPDAAIYYTTDGSMPTTSSTRYSGPIPVGGNGTVTTLTAIAAKAGMNSSTAAQSTYTINYGAAVHSVRYDKNGATGGSEPADSTNYLPGFRVTVLDNTGGLTKTGYVFSGWNTAADGSDPTTYTAGQTFLMGNDDVTLFARWVLLPPSTPTALTVGSPTFTTLSVSWNPSPVTTSYQLYRAPSDGQYSLVYDGPDTSYTDTGLTKGTTYSYEVQATNAAGSSTLSTAVSGATRNEFLYVTNSYGGNLSAYSIRGDGSLSPVGTYSTSPGPQPYGIAASPNGNYLYVTDTTLGLTAYSIGAGGALSQIGNYPGGPSNQYGFYHPTGVAISRDGSYLYVANYDSATISIFRILANGSLSLIDRSCPSISHPYGIAISPDGSYLYVTNGDGPNRTYRIQGDGRLSVAGSDNSRGGGAWSLDGIAISPDGSYLYLTYSTTLSVYRIQVSAGGGVNLSLIHDYGNWGGPTGIAISPNGSHLYLTGGRTPGLAACSIGAGGSLSQIGTYSTGTYPTGVAISGDGSFLYVTNRGNNTVSAYSIGAGGGLTLIGTLATGFEPFGIVIVVR